MEPDRRKLTARQELFVAAYVRPGTSGTEAARQAGYRADPARRAHELLRNPRVQERLRRMTDAYEVAREWSVNWWREQMADAHRQAVDAGDLPSRLRALELVGRHLGAFESRADHASAELSARLTQHLVQAMALQMATQPSEGQPQTIEGQVRAMIGPGAAQ